MLATLKRLHSKYKFHKVQNLLRYTRTFMGNNVGSWPDGIDGADMALRFRNVVLLAPHQDDEAFGLGGLLSAFAAGGSQVTFTWFSRGQDPIRVPEAKRMMEILGAKTHQVDCFPIASEPVVVEESIAVIEKLIKDVKPDLICVPSIFDSHLDHMRLNLAVDKALRSTCYDGMILQYEVWNTLIPNLLVDISAFINQKRALMEVFRSQLNLNNKECERNRNYIERTLSLNRYRGMPHRVDYAEGYILCTADQFLGYQQT
ncbi:PIG-L deacetylase family protein [Prosthecobacter sp.]|uniref:PIG-L deacetylase family protein n=1 Tax=Prosthecobacter sp. TaxID=1965333 RepID=UPI002489DD32|nr:PIG-L deacetylase family protein [Prosthecobacter sp.]MDI1310847.1 PIG-L family deacetylase [Prosthecobacter sp.]